MYLGSGGSWKCAYLVCVCVFFWSKLAREDKNFYVNEDYFDTLARKNVY